MPLPSRPGQTPASSSTPNLAAEPATQSFAPRAPDAARTSALPAWDAQGEGYTEAFPGSADQTSALPAPDAARTSALPAWDAQGEGYTEAFPGSGDPTTALPAPDAARTSALPAGAAHTSVMPAEGGPAAPGAPVRTTVMPARRRSAPTPPEPARQPAPPRRRPEPVEPVEPVEREAPVMLPLPPRRRRTLALPLGLLMLIATVGLLGWGSYTFLGSVHILDIAQGSAAGLDLVAGGAVIGGAVLALLTLITSMVAVSRSRPRTAALALMLGAFFLPLGALAAGLYYGGIELKDRTLAEAHDVVGQVDPEQVDHYLAQVEGLGVEVPWREELYRILSGQQ